MSEKCEKDISRQNRRIVSPIVIIKRFAVMPINRWINMDWTEEQKKAIEAATETTAVLAGAGSGKTKVLIERILKLLQSDEADLSQIVAITYTEKAAAELKQRLAKALPEET